MSAVSAFYYLRVVWYLYFREAEEPAAEGSPSCSAPQAGIDGRDRGRRARRAGRGPVPGARHAAAKGAVRLFLGA